MNANDGSILKNIAEADLNHLKEKADNGNEEAQEIIKWYYAYYCIHKNEKTIPVSLGQFFTEASYKKIQ